jgi:hypothetical protein
MADVEVKLFEFEFGALFSAMVSRRGFLVRRIMLKI